MAMSVVRRMRRVAMHRLLGRGRERTPVRVGAPRSSPLLPTGCTHLSITRHASRRQPPPPQPRRQRLHWARPSAEPAAAAWFGPALGRAHRAHQHNGLRGAAVVIGRPTRTGDADRADDLSVARTGATPPSNSGSPTASRFCDEGSLRARSASKSVGVSVDRAVKAIRCAAIASCVSTSAPHRKATRSLPRSTPAIAAVRPIARQASNAAGARSLAWDGDRVR